MREREITVVVVVFKPFIAFAKRMDHLFYQKNSSSQKQIIQIHQQQEEKNDCHVTCDNKKGRSLMTSPRYQDALLNLIFLVHLISAAYEKVDRWYFNNTLRVQ